MAMKYVKLFENWLLTEGEKQDSFDKAKPDNWPVLETKIKDAITANFDESFLQSIFRRALKEENREKLTVSGGGITTQRVTLDIKAMYDAKVKKNTDLKVTLEEFYKFLIRYTKPYFFSDSLKVKKIDDLYAYFQECLENLRNPKGNTELAKNKEFKGLIINSEGNVIKNRQKECIIFVEELKKELERLKTKAESEKVRYIYFGWDEDPIFELICDQDIAKGGEPTDGIINFKCRKLSFPMQAWSKRGDDFVDNELYTKIKGEEMDDIDSTDITFGQVMSWLNVWQDGNSVATLLSSSGKSKYDTACKEIFGSEEAASLPAFASASVKIGTTSVKLANSKTDGTIVPVLAKNIVVGTVGFAYNSSEISETGLKSLASPEIWKMLSSAGKSIIIVGNTDGSGPDEYNKTLSLKRANAVLDVLKQDNRFAKLKATKNVTTRGDGKENLLIPDKKGKDQEAAATNRRVELIIDGQLASDKLKK